MARIETDPNYSNPTFSRGTVSSDLFKKEDDQLLAAALSTHTHAPGYGLPVVLPAGSITSAMIGPGQVTAANISGNSIDGSKIVDGTITGADIAAGTIAGANIANDTITAAQIAAAGVGTSELADGSVTAAKLAPGAVIGQLPQGSLTKITNVPLSGPIGITSGSPVATLDAAHYTPQAGCSGLLVLYVGTWSCAGAGAIASFGLNVNGAGSVASSGINSPGVNFAFMVNLISVVINPPASDQFFQVFVAANVGALNASGGRSLVILEFVR